MKAISIHQPWAWAIMAGHKTIENRTWETSHRGTLLIHTSKTRSSYDREMATWLARFGIDLPPWDDMPKGLLVGSVDLIDCVRVADVASSPWVQGPICWLIKNPVVFTQPIPYRGKLGMFDVPDDLVK